MAEADPLSGGAEDVSNVSFLSQSGASTSVSGQSFATDENCSATAITQQQLLARKSPKDFIFGKIIGEGSFSTVYLGKEVGTGREFAIKVCEKRLIKKERKVAYVLREKEVMNILNTNPHPSFIRLYCTFQDDDRLYYVMSLAQAGELLDYMRKLGSFDEDVTRFYSAELVLALEHLHKLGIIHRDLKPENILLSADMHIKISDFGSAKILNEDANRPTPLLPVARKNSFVGTAQYVSPEILSGKPSTIRNEYLMFQKISKLDYSFPEGFDTVAKSLVEQLLVIEPSKRIGTPELGGYALLKQHLFFDGTDWENVTSAKPPDIRPYLPAAFAGEESLHSELPDHLEPGLDDKQLTRIMALELADASPMVEPKHAFGLSPKTRRKKVQDQVKNPYHRFVEGNLILKMGLIDKRKGLFARTRMLILTEGPHMYYVDPSNMELKGQIPWSKELRTEAKNFKTFFVHTPNRTYYLIDYTGNALGWCKIIEEVKQFYFDKNAFAPNVGRTRGHRFRLFVRSTSKDCFKHFYSNRTIHDWNALDENIVSVGSYSRFKNLIEKMNFDHSKNANSRPTTSSALIPQEIKCAGPTQAAKLVPSRRAKTAKGLNKTAAKHLLSSRRRALNTSVLKQTLKANNKALALALQNARQLIKELNSANLGLQEENSSLRAENIRLRSESTVEEEIERNVKTKLQAVRKLIQELVSSMSNSTEIVQKLAGLASVDKILRTTGSFELQTPSSAPGDITIPSPAKSPEGNFNIFARNKSTTGTGSAASVSQTIASGSRVDGSSRSVVADQPKVVSSKQQSTKSLGLRAMDLSTVLEMSGIEDAPIAFVDEHNQLDVVMEEASPPMLSTVSKVRSRQRSAIKSGRVSGFLGHAKPQPEETDVTSNLATEEFITDQREPLLPPTSYLLTHSLADAESNMNSPLTSPMRAKSASIASVSRRTTVVLCQGKQRAEVPVVDLADDDDSGGETRESQLGSLSRFVEKPQRTNSINAFLSDIIKEGSRKDTSSSRSTFSVSKKSAVGVAPDVIAKTTSVLPRAQVSDALKEKKNGTSSSLALPGCVLRTPITKPKKNVSDASSSSNQEINVNSRSPPADPVLRKQFFALIEQNSAKNSPQVVIPVDEIQLAKKQVQLQVDAKAEAEIPSSNTANVVGDAEADSDQSDIATSEPVANGVFNKRQLESHRALDNENREKIKHRKKKRNPISDSDSDVDVEEIVKTVAPPVRSSVALPKGQPEARVFEADDRVAKSSKSSSVSACRENGRRKRTSDLTSQVAVSSQNEAIESTADVEDNNAFEPRAVAVAHKKQNGNIVVKRSALSKDAVAVRSKTTRQDEDASNNEVVTEDIGESAGVFVSKRKKRTASVASSPQAARASCSRPASSNSNVSSSHCGDVEDASNSRPTRRCKGVSYREPPLGKYVLVLTIIYPRARQQLTVRRITYAPAYVIKITSSVNTSRSLVQSVIND